jgi:hypothetical protein
MNAPIRFEALARKQEFEANKLKKRLLRETGRAIAD